MPPLTLPDDERTAAFRQQIDRCEFRIIRLYVESQHSNIKAAFGVDRSIRLEQVAVVVAFGDDATMRRLMSEGLVKRIDTRLRIADEVQCSVIYLEPAYNLSIESRVIFWSIVGYRRFSGPSQNSPRIVFSLR